MPGPARGMRRKPHTLGGPPWWPVVGRMSSSSLSPRSRSSMLAGVHGSSPLHIAFMSWPGARVCLQRLLCVLLRTARGGVLPLLILPCATLAGAVRAGQQRLGSIAMDRIVAWGHVDPGYRAWTPGVSLWHDQTFVMRCGIGDAVSRSMSKGI